MLYYTRLISSIRILCFALHHYFEFPVWESETKRHFLFYLFMVSILKLEAMMSWWHDSKDQQFSIGALAIAAASSNLKPMRSVQEQWWQGHGVDTWFRFQLNCMYMLPKGIGRKFAHCWYVAAAHGYFEIARQRAALGGGPAPRLASAILSYSIHGRVRVATPTVEASSVSKSSLIFF